MSDDPLPTIGMLFSVQVALACLRQQRIDDALLVLDELAQELFNDVVAESAAEAQYVSFQ